MFLLLFFKYIYIYYLLIICCKVNNYKMSNPFSNLSINSHVMDYKNSKANTNYKKHNMNELNTYSNTYSNTYCNTTDNNNNKTHKKVKYDIRSNNNSVGDDDNSDDSLILINNNDVKTAFGLSNNNTNDNTNDNTNNNTNTNNINTIRQQRTITHKQHNENILLKHLYINTIGLSFISIIGFGFTLKSYFILDDIINNNTSGIYNNYSISNNIYDIDINLICIYALIILLCYAIYITFNIYIYIFYMISTICFPSNSNYTKMIMFNNYVFKVSSLLRLVAVCALIIYNINDTPFLQVNITNINNITNNEIININTCSYYNYLLIEIIIYIVILCNNNNNNYNYIDV